MGLCKDCQFWERRRSTKTWRTCVLTRVRDNTEEHPESQAVAEASIEYGDGSLHAALLTTPEFGCNQFEAR